MREARLPAAEMRARAPGVARAAAALLVALVAVAVGARPAGVRADDGPSVGAAVGLGGAGLPLGSRIPLELDVKGGAGGVTGAEVVVDTGPSSAGSTTTSGGCITTSSGNGGTSIMCTGSAAGSAGSPGLPLAPPQPTGGSLPGMRYRIPVDLPPGVEKHLTVGIQLTGAPIHVTLQQGGTTLASSVVTPAQGGGRSLVAIVADPHASLSSIQGVSVSSSTPGVDAVQLSVEDLPDRAELLRPLQTIIVDGAATGSMTQGQRSALTAWVAGGGGLILTTGALARQTLAGIPSELVAATAGAAQPATSLGALSALVGAGAIDSAVQVAPLSPVSGAAVGLRGTDGSPLLVERAVGMGTVVVTAFDPGTEPLASWSGQRPLLGDLVARTAGPATTTVYSGKGGVTIGQVGPFAGSVPDDVQMGGEVGAVLALSPGLSLPSSATVGILLLVYVVVAGPVSYAVLARLRRRDLLWLTIPALAVAAGITAYSTGLGSRGASVLTTEVRVVHLTGLGSPATVDSYAAVWTPHGGDADVPVLGPLSVAGLSALSRDDGATLAVAAGPASAVELRGAPSASIHGFSAESTATVTGGLAFDLSLAAGGRLNGTVTNHLGTALHDVHIVSIYGLLQDIGDLADGATVHVSAAVGTASGCCAGGVGPSCLPVCGRSAPSDLEQERRAMLASILSSHLTSPVLTGVAEHPLLAPDLGGGSVDVIDAVEAPIVFGGQAWARSTQVAGWLLSQTSAPNGSGASQPAAVSAVYSFQLPAGTATASVIVPNLTTSCAGCPVPVPCIPTPTGVSCVAASVAPSGPAGASTPDHGVSLAWLDPVRGDWSPLGVSTSGSGATADLPPAAVRSGAVILRIGTSAATIVTSAPVISVTGSGATP